MELGSVANLYTKVSVDRTSLSLSDLELEQPGKYRVVAFGPGLLSRRRDVARSPFVDGEVLLSTTKDVMNLYLDVRCYGSTWAALEANIAELLAAFDQFEYTLKTSFGDPTDLSADRILTNYLCQPADYGPSGGGLDPFHMRAKQQVYSFLIPRNPNPTVGVF